MPFVAACAHLCTAQFASSGSTPSGDEDTVKKTMAAILRSFRDAPDGTSKLNNLRDYQVQEDILIVCECNWLSTNVRCKRSTAATVATVATKWKCPSVSFVRSPAADCNLEVIQ